MTGFLIDPGDDAALEEGMRRAADDPALAARLGTPATSLPPAVVHLGFAVAERMLAAIAELSPNGGVGGDRVG